MNKTLPEAAGQSGTADFFEEKKSDTTEHQKIYVKYNTV